MRRYCLFFWVWIIGGLGHLWAQQDRLQITPKEEGLGLRPEIRVGAGVSIPLGRYALLDSVCSKNGAAKMGGGLDVVLTHRLRRSPLLGIHVAVGYMQHGFKAAAIQAYYQLNSFTGKDWSLVYLMPGIGLQGGKRFKFEINAHAGLTFYNGWNAQRADYITDKGTSYWTREWKYPWRTAGGFRGGLLLGYKFNDKGLLFAEGWVYYAWGSRIGSLTEMRYDLDSDGIPLDTPSDSETFRVIHAPVLFTVNVCVGLKYNLYRYLNEPQLPSDQTTP